jgi:uncharacterized protein
MTATYPFRTALVTGASSGIGAEIARQLAAAGVSTVVVARRADRLEELAARHGNVEVLAADLFTDDGIALVASRITDPHRPIDLVVNNAGFGTSGRFHELEAHRLVREIDLNCSALTTLSHAALSAMVPRRRGWLMNVSSVASFQPTPGLAVYSATKAYVTSLTEALHEEVKSSGVLVTALCPGLVRTEFQSISNTSGFEAKFPDAAWLDVEHLVRDGLADLVKGRAISVPGILYKGLASLSNVLPRWAARRVSGAVSTARGR